MDMKYTEFKKLSDYVWSEKNGFILIDTTKDK